MKKRTAIYPGSFDPVTYGHIDIVDRGLRLFDEIIVLIAESPEKKGLFSVSEKKEMLSHVFKKEKRVRIDHWEGLLMAYAKKNAADAILRGLRAISDFEYEFQMASMNKRLCPKIDTIFMMTSENHSFISSRLVREVASLGGNLKDIVPAEVEKRLNRKFGK